MKVKLNPTVAAYVLWPAAVGIVVIGSLSPGDSWLMGSVDRLGIWDKALHFGAYLLLAVLPALGFQKRSTALWSAGSMVLLGLLLEIAQKFIPGRSPEAADELANAVGVSCGMALVFPLRSTFRGAALAALIGFPIGAYFIDQKTHFLQHG